MKIASKITILLKFSNFSFLFVRKIEPFVLEFAQFVGSINKV